MKFQIEHAGYNIIHLDDTDEFSEDSSVDGEDYIEFVNNNKVKSTLNIDQFRKNIHRNTIRDTKIKKKKKTYFSKLTDAQKKDHVLFAIKKK